jgi:hypothetical protein
MRGEGLGIFQQRSPSEKYSPRSTKYLVPSTQYSIRPWRSCIVLLNFLLVPAAALAQDAENTAKQPALSAAQMLERFGVDASQQAAFFSGQPLTTSEEDVLAKVLYQVPRLGRDNLHRWRQATVPFDALRANPAAHRFEVFRLQGRVIQVTKRALLAEQAELYEFGHYYLVTIALAHSPHQALVAARHVPAAWQLEAPLDEPAAVDALFLKTGDAASEPWQFILAAERVGWFPEKADPSRGIGRSDLALAKAGFDIGLWDAVRSSKEHTLAGADREAFYQLLSVLGKVDPASIRSAASESVQVAKLLAKPAEHQGDVFPVEGVARRVMRVPVSDADVRTRFGIDHYYEIDFFIPLEGPSLRLGKGGKDAEGPVFENEFPATLIVRHLPVGLEEGDSVHQLIAADAVFFKVWAYRSNYTAKFGQLQPAPLFMAAEPRVVIVEPASAWLTGTLVLVALGLALAVAAAVLWSHRRDDKKARRRTQQETLDFRF